MSTTKEMISYTIDLLDAKRIKYIHSRDKMEANDTKYYYQRKADEISTAIRIIEEVAGINQR